MTVKTDVSRFQIHDELTAPDESAPILKSIQAAGGAVSQVRRRARRLPGGAARLHADALGAARRRPAAGDPRADRARGRRAPRATPTASPSTRSRPAAPGLGLDEVSRARSFTSADPKEAALLDYLKAALEADGHPPLHLHEEAREAGWTDEEILEAVGHLALNEFQSLIASAAALPKDQATPRVLPSAA